MALPDAFALGLVGAVATAAGWATWRAMVRLVDLLAEAVAHRIVLNLLAEPRIIDHLAAAVAERLGLDPPDPRPPERG